MVSAVNAISTWYYTSLANNAAYNMLSASNARTNLISSPMMYNVSFGALAALDTQYELDMITNSLQYKMARAMLEQLRKQHKEDAERFSIFA